jgi:hydroxybutyrate-dimer hydrolase
MWAHLTAGAALPPSQVVATTPRALPTDTITTANVPPIVSAPRAKAIVFSGNLLHIPN